jgi:hypothetical protein
MIRHAIIVAVLALVSTEIAAAVRMIQAAVVPLALQLQFALYVSLSCCGLVSAAPDGPCNDVSRANTPLGQTRCDASDLLNRPADQLTL